VILYSAFCGTPNSPTPFPIKMQWDERRGEEEREDRSMCRVSQMRTGRSRNHRGEWWSVTPLCNVTWWSWIKYQRFHLTALLDDSPLTSPSHLAWSSCATYQRCHLITSSGDLGLRAWCPSISTRSNPGLRISDTPLYLRLVIVGHVLATSFYHLFGWSRTKYP
jgi:hypothetical protein